MLHEELNQENTIPGFREVPRTGVIYVMNRAIEAGYTYGDTTWANLGQGAPETNQFEDGPARISRISLTSEAHEYGPVSGITKLREAVAHFYNEVFRKGKKSKYTFRNVAISGGGRVGLARIAAALGDINLGHFIPDYTAYEELLAIFKEFTPIPLILDPKNQYEISKEELTRNIEGLGLSAILASNPSNPTGKFVWGTKLQEWVEVARKTHCTFILDEFYSHYAYQAVQNPYKMVSAAEFVDDVNHDPIVIVDGVTKNWRYPGLRISWTVAPQEVIDAIASAGSFLDGGANHPLQEATIPLLDPEFARKETESLQKVFSKKREYMLKELRRLGFVVENEPHGAFYVWVNLTNLPEPLQSGEGLFEEGLKEKVITVPGEFFDVNPGKRRSRYHSRYKNYARISFGPEMEALTRGVAALERVIQKFS